MPSPTAPAARRSRNGCRECRRRHRRCDEAKPGCGYCSSVGKNCQYARELSWGGKPFGKSRFGSCVGRGNGVIKKVVSSDNAADDGQDDNESGQHQLSFVYVSRTSPSAQTILEPQWSAGQDYSETTAMAPEDDQPIYYQDPGEDDAEDEISNSYSYDQTVDLPRPCRGLALASSFNTLLVRDQALFDYFQHQLTRSISCHEGMQVEICSALIPIAMQSQSMMAAVLCTAAHHRVAVGLEQLQDRALRLRSQALQHLYCSLGSRDEAVLLSALGTSLALCLSDVASPSTMDASWHIHLVGASTLLKRFYSVSQSGGSDLRLLVRLYTSFKSIAASCSKRVEEELFDPSPLSSDQDYIDDLAGFSTRLNPIMQAMRMIDEAQESPSDTTSHIFLRAARSTHQYAQLICRVEEMNRNDSVVSFRPEIQDTLSDALKHDFVKLDEAYHHMVLLQLYNRADTDQACFQNSIRTSIRHIIDCIAAMNITARPCPAVATLPPLFEAGYWSTSQTERQGVRDLLSRTRACYGMGNVTCAMEFLDERLATHGDDGIRAPTRSVTRGLDFLPY
ncbi:fungal zn2-cys6 binuclear cluster domain-containing [Fusarium longipes]|uniref:Fungal zn2-cys6 binuclear cluster domain-containing n=1 Tax=Fusarium longipes TaxID=694270 RepID=A0A395RIJ8_9HYPO|nr:fungal zn2-cys6 binuclear cluster domain-containing [Fusarium longipes]